MNKNPIGRKLRDLREEQNITQDEAGKYIGVTQSNYGRLEKNDNRISIVTLQQLAKFFKEPIINFFT